MTTKVASAGGGHGGGGPHSVVQFPGDRVTEQQGCTKLAEKGAIKVSSWELKDPTCCETLCLTLRCSTWDKSRGYLYIRDNGSFEMNDTNGMHSCCCVVQDNIWVENFDRAPWDDACKPAPPPCCCFCYKGVPKIEVMDLGCMCCCMHCDPCCCGKRVVIMPFEMFPPPCCCCRNRVNKCDNCCELCGGVTGNPKIFNPFIPQPKDPAAFVEAAQLALAQAVNRHGAPPDAEEMDR